VLNHGTLVQKAVAKASGGIFSFAKKIREKIHSSSGMTETGPQSTCNQPAKCPKAALCG